MTTYIDITIDDENGGDTSFFFPGLKRTYSPKVTIDDLGQETAQYDILSDKGIRSHYSLEYFSSFMETFFDNSDMHGYIHGIKLSKQDFSTQKLEQIAHLDVSLDPFYPHDGAVMASALGLTPDSLMNELGNYTSVTLRLHGNMGDDWLGGSNRDDLLDGQIGADTMVGLGGSDTYYVDDPGDRVVEAAHGGGYDTVNASTSYKLSSNVEDLVLLGTGNFKGTGNDGENTLTGNSGKNTLTGGKGDDIYYIQTKGDHVVEAAKGGHDIVYSSVTYTAEANVEDVTLQDGAGAIDVAGNKLDNALRGNDSRNTLTGGAGDDTYYIGKGDKVVEAKDGGTDKVVTGYSYTLPDTVENLQLASDGSMRIGKGNAGANTIQGSAYNNTLDGGGGKDTMIGYSGDDTFVTDGGDKIVEKKDDGIDTVKSSVSYTLGKYLENLTLTGSKALNGTGNDAKNTLKGNSGVNTLTGGKDDDTYYVQTKGDHVVEKAGEGKDTVHASISWKLGSEVENLYLDGKSAINATGNSGANGIVGNSAANRLDGGKGADTLVGAGGKDTFVFHKGSGNDLIADFIPSGGAFQHIQFDKAQYADFNAVLAHAYAPQGEMAKYTIITDGTDSVTLFCMKSQLYAGDFVFV